MEIDKTTLNDLSLFNSEEEFSVFHKLNNTRTARGREQLRVNFNTPLLTIEAIEGVQQTIQSILSKEEQWPLQISNGTIMVIEKFYLAAIDEIPANPSAFTVYNYKIFHSADYALVKYSIKHAFDFIKGMQAIVQHFLQEDSPKPLQRLLLNAKQILNKNQFVIVQKSTKIEDLSLAQQLHLVAFLRYHYKQNMFELLAIYAQLDAWYGMGQSMKEYKLVFPQFINGDQPIIAAKALRHILLANPVSYDVTLHQQSNFMFLTGANMAGKSTFIKSVGTAVFLAHIGIGVPAQEMQLSFFDGLLSNINVLDNLQKGESYFYNEVQRIKATIDKVSNGKKWLILIDELFKGTNVEDAMKCSSTVIEGLLKIKSSLFILSTHLYEIGAGLKKYPNISFNYFETTITEQREGVVNMLDRL
ncbi:MAG: DNA mismatch repair protein MutS [Sphingobacteriales bacterium]|nr:DNA mismatch repair protein MutS [Sphingobacteriales bacterium]